MITQLKMILVAFLCVAVTACSTSNLQAPCDQYAHFCGSKTKINQW